MTTPRDAGGAKTLEAKYYTSEEVFALETERIFRRSWLCCGRASEIAAGGNCSVFQLGDDSVLLVRDEADELRAFANVCRHRGTRLCEDGGTVEKVIRCPYHGWTYDLTGRLVNAPNMRDVDGFDPADFPLRQVATAEWEGFVFVHLSEDPPPASSPRAAIGGLYRPLQGTFRDWNLAELICVERLNYQVRANWKLLFQNFNECYHCPRVHPRLNSLSTYSSAANDLDEGPFLGGPMELAVGVATMTTTGETCGLVFPGLSEANRRRVFYFSLFPTMFLSPHPDYVLTHRIEPIGVSETRVICEFLFHPDATARSDFDPSPAVEFWDETNRQDWRVCELSQAGISSMFYSPGPYSNLESIVAAFDRHYRQALGPVHTGANNLSGARRSLRISGRGNEPRPSGSGHGG